MIVYWSTTRCGVHKASRQFEAQGDGMKENVIVRDCKNVRVR